MAELDPRKFGYFVPYRTDSGQCQQYKEIVNEHLAYCSNNQVIKVFGLHNTVLNAKMWCNKKMAQHPMIDILLDSSKKVKRDDGTIKTWDTIQSIESTKYHDSDGKWHFVISKDLAAEAKKLIDEVVIKKGMATVEFQRSSFEKNKNKKITSNMDRGAALFEVAVKRNKKNWMKTKRDFTLDTNFQLHNRHRAKAYLPMSTDEFPALPTATMHPGQQHNPGTTSRTWTTVQVSPSPNLETLELNTLDGSVDASSIASLAASVKDLQSMMSEQKKVYQVLTEENKVLVEELTAKLEAETGKRGKLEAEISNLKKD
jgi:hypothetical protein